MKGERSGIWLGVALIVLGVALLLHRMVPWWARGDVLWGSAFVIVGAALLLSHRQQPRRALPLLAWVAFGLAAIFYLEAIGGIAEDLKGAAFFLALASGFYSLGGREPGRWWGILVGGIFFVLAVVSAVSSLDVLNGDLTGAVFFLGLGFVFTYLYAIRSDALRLGWAKIPALACFAVAALIIVEEAAEPLRPYFWPALFILAGLGLILRDLTRRREPQMGTDEE